MSIYKRLGISLICWFSKHQVLTMMKDTSPRLFHASPCPTTKPRTHWAPAPFLSTDRQILNFTTQLLAELVLAWSLAPPTDQTAFCFTAARRRSGILGAFTVKLPPGGGPWRSPHCDRPQKWSVPPTPFYRRACLFIIRQQIKGTTHKTYKADYS